MKKKNDLRVVLPSSRASQLGEDSSEDQIRDLNNTFSKQKRTVRAERSRVQGTNEMKKN